MGIFKPKIQDAKRLAEKAPGMAGKFAGLPWDMLGDALLSMQISLQNILNMELWKMYHEETKANVDNVREWASDNNDKLVEAKATLENIYDEVKPATGLGYVGFRGETEESLNDILAKLDNVLNGLSLANGMIEEIPKEPPPPPPPDEACIAMAKAMEALSKKQFKVDYALIKQIVTEALKPTLDKVNQVDAKSITISADVKKLLKKKDGGTDDEEDDASLVKIAKDIKEIQKTVIKVQEATTQEFKGVVTIPDCDPKKKPIKVSYQGKGLAGLLSFHQAQSKYFEAIKEQTCDISGGNQPVPDTWNGKALDGIPSLVLSFAPIRKDGKKASANYDVTIPHYNGAVKPKAPPIAMIKKGNYYSYVVFKDGTKAMTYVESQAESARFQNAVLKMVPKQWHKSPLDLGFGIRTSVSRIKQTLVCKSAAYWADGRKSPYPAWTVKF